MNSTVKYILTPLFVLLLGCQPASEEPKQNLEFSSPPSLDSSLTLEDILPSQNNPTKNNPNTPAAHQCDDLVKSQGAKAALPTCLDQAKAGDVHAQGRLGALYVNGELGVENWQEAMAWFIRAADQGHPEAQHIVATSYQLGRGVSKNDDLALLYLKKAAENKIYSAQYELATLLIARNEIAENRQKLAEYLQPAAKAGDYAAQVNLATVLMDFSLPQYDKAAFNWLNKSAEQGYAHGMYLLGKCYYNGIGTEINYEKAFPLFQQLAEKNHPLAQYMLGQMYYYAQGTESNFLLARKWILSAALKNVVEANALLAIFLKEDNHLEEVSDEQQEDYHTWINYAAANGSVSALFEKGKNHLFGLKSFNQDIPLGMQLINTAAKQGYSLAQQELEHIYENNLFGYSKENPT
ncbi:MAG: tetratricopeptide repeat protein [Candidatus Berkiellales bacterium]